MKNTHIIPGSVSNLLDAYSYATDEQVNDGRGWYPLANTIASQLGNGNTYKGAGIIAALSPSCPWPANISDAWQLVERDSVHFQSGFNERRARRIRDADFLSYQAEYEFSKKTCRKVRAFYQSIIDPTHTRTEYICIDTHAANAYAGRRVSGKEKTQLDNVDVRERIQAAYAEAAELSDETLADFQAIVWLVARGIDWQINHR